LFYSTEAVLLICHVIHGRSLLFIVEISGNRLLQMVIGYFRLLSKLHEYRWCMFLTLSCICYEVQILIFSVSFVMKAGLSSASCRVA